MFAMLTRGFCTVPPKSNCRASSSLVPLCLTTLRAVHGAGVSEKIDSEICSSLDEAARHHFTHVYSIVSLERTGSQQHFHNQSKPACSLSLSGLRSSDDCISLVGRLTRLVHYEVRCLTAGATTPSHVAAVVSGWSDSRVSAFLHLGRPHLVHTAPGNGGVHLEAAARERACWWFWSTF